MKAVTPEESSQEHEINPDQVALESVDQDGPPLFNFQYPPPSGPGPSRSKYN